MVGTFFVVSWWEPFWSVPNSLGKPSPYYPNPLERNFSNLPIGFCQGPFYYTYEATPIPTNTPRLKPPEGWDTAAPRWGASVMSEAFRLF